MVVGVVVVGVVEVVAVVVGVVVVGVVVPVVVCVVILQCSNRPASKAPRMVLSVLAPYLHDFKLLTTMSPSNVHEKRGDECLGARRKLTMSVCSDLTVAAHLCCATRTETPANLSESRVAMAPKVPASAHDARRLFSRLVCARLRLGTCMRTRPGMMLPSLSVPFLPRLHLMALWKAETVAEVVCVDVGVVVVAVVVWEVVVGVVVVSVVVPVLVGVVVVGVVVGVVDVGVVDVAVVVGVYEFVLVGVVVVGVVDAVVVTDVDVPVVCVVSVVVGVVVVGVVVGVVGVLVGVGGAALQ